MLRLASPGRRALAVAGAALAVGTAAAARPLALVDGVQFTYKVSSSRKDQKGAPSASYVSSIRMAGGNVRMDYVEGLNPMAGKDGYVVMRGDDERMAIVNVKEKQVMVMDAAAMGSGLGALMNNPMLKLEFKDQEFAFEELGAGEAVLGHKTRRFRLRQKLTVEARVLGMRNASTTESVTDQWVANDLPGTDDRGMRRWARAFGAGIRVFSPAMSAQIEKYQQASRGGVPLRSVMVSTTGDGKKTTTDTTTMEVVDLKRASFDASVFGWPESYQVVDMGQALAGAGAAADSLRAASPDSGPGAKAQVKDAAVKEGVKAGLRGILGRKKP
ncbi:hypothetical protein [Roseisolibacter sp. H3M3-2]|uniref:hypothetical protein n=1 Tax=Roseisolibacter sp. H3M3-2 TaxID=3031323 RepID=UPI0023DBE0D6|nr:hypothetical protein [Roseisolibacter sp. H3M3-2]MDF1503107.1 hypothetical protein [Roseisolibacter sp. H3M3-2]